MHGEARLRDDKVDSPAATSVGRGPTQRRDQRRTSATETGRRSVDDNSHASVK